MQPLEGDAPVVVASPVERLHRNAALNPLFQIKWRCTGRTRRHGVNSWKRTLHLFRRHMAQDSIPSQDFHFILAVIFKTVKTSSRIIAQLTTFHQRTRPPLPQRLDVRDFMVHSQPTHGPHPRGGLCGRLAEQSTFTGYEPQPLTVLDLEHTSVTSSSNVTVTECATNFPTTAADVNDDDLA